MDMSTVCPGVGGLGFDWSWGLRLGVLAIGAKIYCCRCFGLLTCKYTLPRTTSFCFDPCFFMLLFLGGPESPDSPFFQYLQFQIFNV